LVTSGIGGKTEFDIARGLCVHPCQ
jgi:hypothetical protein